MEHWCVSHTPLSFVPLEARFEPDRNFSVSADIWSLACSVWIILGQRPLFEDIPATPDDNTAEQVDTIGNLPPRWWEKWKARHEYFDGRGHPNQDRNVRSWEDRFEKQIPLPRQKAGMSTFDEEEKDAVMDMLRSMLFFEPQKRYTARGILYCEWMERWALPDFENFFTLRNMRATKDLLDPVHSPR